MTHDGVKSLMQVFVASYPNYKPQDMKATIQVWERMLKNYSDAETALAAEAYIMSDTSGFAPSIGKIISLINTKGEEMTGLEAWGLVDKAIRNGVYGAEKEYNALPDVVKLAVGSPGQLREWAQMDVKAVQSVAQSNFLRSYDAAVQRQQFARTMPPQMAALYERSIPQIELKEEETPIEDGVPMPLHLKERLGL